MLAINTIFLKELIKISQTTNFLQTTVIYIERHLLEEERYISHTCNDLTIEVLLAIMINKYFINVANS